MSDYPDSYYELSSDTDRIESLLTIDKEQRGAKRSDLIFLGTANVAEYYWCAMQSLYKSIKDEFVFYRAYLDDRITYSFELSLIDKLPDKEEEIVKIGCNITMKDIEKLLKERAKKQEQSHTRGVITAIEKMDKNGEKVVLINPSISTEERDFHISKAESEGKRVADIDEFPLIRGEFIEESKSEKYPSIRWNFQWDKYVIVGVPDGITDDFVYEFKSTRTRGLLRYTKPVARTQADLYGYFFKRPNKRVQYHILDEDVIDTLEDEVKNENAELVLQKFKAMDSGVLPIAPKEWKCKKCNFKDSCKLYGA